jgi:glycosyltransferase involved in cell wall biosynthesis
MKILFGNQIFEGDYFWGVNKYYGILFDNLPTDIEVVQPCFIKNIFIKQDNFPKSLFYKKKAFYQNEKKKCFLTFLKKSLPFSNKIFSYLLNNNERIFLQRIVNGNFDILHLDLCCVPSEKLMEAIKNVKKPIILTVHDLMGEIVLPSDKNYFKFKQFSENALYLMRNATKIIAISNTTKRDLVNLFNIDPNRIECIYNCYDIVKSKPCDNVELPKRYILYVGQRFHRKNFHFFLNSIRDILLQDKDLKLVFTMQDFTDEERSYAGYIGVLDSCIFINANSENNLAYLYENALCCAVPTLYEGFGMIIAESMAYACPVVTSNIDSSMKEVGGDAVAYFDPYDQHSIRDVMKEVLYDDNLRQKMREDGLKQVKNFMPEKMINAITNTYKSVL